MTRDGTGLDEQLCFALHGASRQLTRAYRVVLEPLGLTYPQYLVVLALREPREGPPSVRELGLRLRLDSATLTPLLQRLERAGYVRRDRDPGDERVVRIELGPRALEADAALRAIPRRMLAASPLPVERLVRLRDDAKALADALERELGAAEAPTTSPARGVRELESPRGRPAESAAKPAPRRRGVSR